MAKGNQKIPALFLERLRRIVPEDRFEAVLRTFSEPAAASFRVNTLRAGRDEVVAELRGEGLSLHEVDWMAEAFWVEPEERARLLETAAYREGRIYVQNLSSMVPPLVLDPRPGERVLDLTAAPGSKTLQIACQMEQEGEIAAVELVRSRFFKMRANLEAQGAHAVRTFMRNGETVWRHRPDYFDRVLLDAPCSTEGRFHESDPASYAFWGPKKIDEMARKQRRLLFSAVRSLQPGGVLVYSTCAFAPEENEAVLDAMLRKFDGELTVEPLGLELDNMIPPLPEWQGTSFSPALAPARRVLPTRTMEGFFVARLSRR